MKMEFQGKDKQNYENSAKAAWYSIVILLTFLVGITLFSSCSTTKKADECCSKKESVK